MERASKQFVISVKKQKRENKSLLFLDNIKIIKDALSSNSIKANYILTSLESLPFESQNVPVFKVDSKTIEMLSDSVTPQGIICCGEYVSQPQNLVPTKNFLVLDKLQDPGNVGTLLRTALATGFEDVFVLDGVNITNSKLIRSSAGAIFLLRTRQLSEEDFVNFAKENKLCLLCCHMKGENVFEFQPDGIVGVVVGSEGQGVSKKISSLCTKKLSIPMKNGLESLNAGVSGSIVMYQINKNQF